MEERVVINWVGIVIGVVGSGRIKSLVLDILSLKLFYTVGYLSLEFRGYGILIVVFFFIRYEVLIFWGICWLGRDYFF